MTDSYASRSDLYRRWGELKLERSTWFAHWMDLSAYIQPRSGRYFITDRDRGWKRNNAIYDNTGTRASNILAAGMMGGMTSPARPWMRMSIPDQDLAQHGPVKLWLSQLTKLMLWIFADSNTYRSLHTIYRELGIFGTGASILMDDFQDVTRHYPLTTGEFAIAQNWRGEVDTLYREFEKPVASLVKEFGAENCSPTVQRLFDAGTLDAWVPVVHAIEPRADRDPRMKDAKNKAWKSCYFEVGASDDKFLRESGFDEFPALVPRWDVIGGDIYGNSPGMEALGDIKQLQHEQLRKAQGIDYKTMPPLQVPGTLKGRDVERMPGGVTYIDSATQTGVKTLYDVQLDLAPLLTDIQDVRERIRASFFADLFMMIANSDPRMTATEVAARNEEKMMMLGPVIERLHDELLNPLVDSTFARMIRSGIVPPAPPELHGMDLKVEYVSMLAQAQRAIGTNSVDRFVGNLGQIAAFKPDVVDKFDSDAWADAYSDMLGVDPKLIVPDDKVAVVRQQRAQQQQQAQQAEMANQAADTAQKLGKTPTTGGNAASDIINQFSGYGSPAQ